MGRLSAIVLGSAAGGGFPQWNCRCATCRLAWAGDARVRPRTQASLAVSADGENWLLINASPDLPQQVRQSKVLHPRSATRGSPIKAVVLTGPRSIRSRARSACGSASLSACRTRRERQRSEADCDHSRCPTHASRRGPQVFMVPGKLPLYLEGENPEIAS